MSDENISELAASMILGGGTPRSVALQFPAWFVRNHEGIIRLWETINRRGWRGNEGVRYMVRLLITICDSIRSLA